MPLSQDRIDMLVQEAIKRSHIIKDMCAQNNEDYFTSISTEIVMYLNDLLEEKRLTVRQAERILLTFIIGQITAGDKRLEEYLKERGEDHESE